MIFNSCCMIGPDNRGESDPFVILRGKNKIIFCISLLYFYSSKAYYIIVVKKEGFEFERKN